ncbi:hypothetical protein [Cystobacter fuscus]|uniref:hypothetical protein n=1 Tax=Cystobacter fuscus TaxID=43 RepID=UPI002B310E11|nr:hypothetical protein F0U63_00805 [Cystobacter fuscus]
MGVLNPDEKLIDYVTDYRSGTIGLLGVNDAYDLYLAQQRSGNYILVAFMKIQFFFKDDGKLSWTAFEKVDFVNQWRAAIQQTWGGGRTIKTLKSGKSVGVDFRFQTKIGGWMLDHWELTVKKVPKGSFDVSSVNSVGGNTSLDSEDLTFAVKQRDKLTGAIYKQRGVVHEFGHMLGLDDEYESSSPHNKDYASVMNSGEVIMPRHDAVYMGWLNETLLAKKIT